MLYLLKILIIDKRNILNRIINKGGLLGSCAMLYIDNEDCSERFLSECYQQCHIEELIKFWGKELIEDIIKYNNEYTIN